MKIFNALIIKHCVQNFILFRCSMEELETRLILWEFTLEKYTNEENSKLKGYTKKTRTELLRDLSNIKTVIKIFKMGYTLGLTHDEISNKASIQRNNRTRQSYVYHRKPLGERRDNKKTIVYNGGGTNGNKIRYPSKKRSRSHWKNFYNLFPHLSKQDNWNGKTSTRYNGK